MNNLELYNYERIEPLFKLNTESNEIYIYKQYE